MGKDSLFQSYVSSLCWKCAFKQNECEGFLGKAEALENLLSDNYPVFEIRVKVIECIKFITPRDVRNEKLKIKNLEKEKVRLAKKKEKLQLTDTERKIWELRTSGLVYRDISKEVGITFQRAHQCFRRAQNKIEAQLLS